MFEKIKNIFKEKDDKKKMENLVAFLIILVVTLILVNKILKGDSGSKTGFVQNQSDVQLVNYKSENVSVIGGQTETDSNSIEQRLERILSRIIGVRGNPSFSNI